MPTIGQSKPVFSPVGSQSKLSAGAQSIRPTSPIPGFSGGRRPQLKVPSPVVTSTSPRPRQNSAPEPSTPHRRTASPVPRGQLSTTLSAQLSPRQIMSSTMSRHLSSGSQGVRSATSMGHRTYHETDNSQQSQHRRRTSLGGRPTVQITRTEATSGDANESIYGLGLNPASSSASSMGLEMPSEEPTSPSTSSSSSIGSLGRVQPSQLLQSSGLQQSKKSDVSAGYRPVRGDELDEEFARILNASPAQIQVKRLSEGKYYFGGKVEEKAGRVVNTGGKTVLCRIMEYGRSTGGSVEDSGASFDTSALRRPDPVASRSPRPRTKSLNSASSAQATPARTRKVLVRVGGGWQDLDIYLLDHGSFGK